VILEQIPVGIVGTIPAQCNGMRLQGRVKLFMPPLVAANFETIWSDNDHVCKRRNEDDEGKRGQVG
jgi:hypothetical protein